MSAYFDEGSSSAERRQARTPSVIVIGGGMAGLAAARTLADASFKVEG